MRHRRSRRGRTASVEEPGKSLSWRFSVSSHLRFLGLGPAAAHVTAGCIVAILEMVTDLLDRNNQAHARGREHVAPVSDQLLVGLADIADLAVEIEQPKRVDVAVLLAKRGIPVDLVGEAVPG